ncbi:O-antigen ligase family protein [Sulfurovum mangrovi]|uniref:O-antigen ligase family protein n=1 Tax=Sulfurovum mangrovi TaxID=2893889 RepID=UPI001E3FDB72|nr:O-antigen ligase family protein [Sulfurovum mangrovi]UFH59216.1 O-antigen ligase family protein [Sulfurovum mangrovi]
MKKILDFLFVSLLFTYPLIVLLPREFNIVGGIWGGASLVFVVLAIFLHRRLITNKYVFIASIISMFILLSILLSEEINFLKFQYGLKVVLPLFLASYFYVYPLNETKLLRIYYFVYFYILFLFLFFIYRYSLINFNPLLITAFRDMVWYEKSHIIAQTFIIFAIIFLFLSYRLKKNVTLAYMFFIPVLLTGVRSVMLGGILFLMVFLLHFWKKHFLWLVISVLVMGISLIIIQPDITKLLPLILSERDANLGTQNMNITTMSSGRDIIISYYIDHLDYERLFVGSGMQYLESDASFTFGLHNDILEFFFSFGIFGLGAFLIGFYYWILYDAYKKTSGINRVFIKAIGLLIISISSFAFFFSNQVIIYMFILIYIITYYQVPKGNLTHAN